MFIAQELRKSNIAEYLLYMWQVENIIRAFDCSLSRIRKEYIVRFEYDEEQKEEPADREDDRPVEELPGNPLRKVFAAPPP